MTDDVPASQRWRGRPVHSLLVQAFVFAIPIIASVAAATAVSAVGPKPRSVWEFVAWWVVLTAIALAVLVLVDRMARKLLPLATLLKLSMLFPDRAPSRFRVARNAASVRRLSEQLAAARERGLTAEPIWAAETVLTLITALGHHDRRSRGHSERVHVYTELLADELDLPEFDRDRLRWAALLHDVGKLMIPSELLNKADSPDDEEWHALRRHPDAGAQLCAPLLEWLGEWGLAISQHHEWFDGTGYPRGLSGMQISRAARIVAVADCYEVMTTSRTYKRAMNPAAAREELARCAGTQFDPAIVRAFLNVSIGKLRLAMGPLALLSTLPSMARLASLLEPLARAGAVLGGAAIIVGGGSVLPPDATAQPAPSDPPAPVPVAVADSVPAPGRAPASRPGPGERAAAGPAAGGAGDTQDDEGPVTEVAGVRRERPEATAERRRPTGPSLSAPATPVPHRPQPEPEPEPAAATGEPPANRPPNRPADREPAEVAGGRPSQGPDKPRPEPVARTESPGEPEPARESPPAGESEDRGANPTAPPTAPPGRQPEHPDGTPPPDPSPPGNPEPGEPQSSRATPSNDPDPRTPQ